MTEDELYDYKVELQLELAKLNEEIDAYKGCISERDITLNVLDLIESKLKEKKHDHKDMMIDLMYQEIKCLEEDLQALKAMYVRNATNISLADKFYSMVTSLERLIQHEERELDDYQNIRRSETTCSLS